MFFSDIRCIVKSRQNDVCRNMANSQTPDSSEGRTPEGDGSPISNDRQHLVGSHGLNGYWDPESLEKNYGTRRRSPCEREPTPDSVDAISSVGSTESANLNFMGTLTGVFSPVSLSMFSSLLFLRVGYIVGNAGLTVSIILLVFAYFILSLTILSISAISTNGAVKGGGVYFMISRTLGPELGGSIGVLFWAANTVGSALFATGCTEAIMTTLGPQGIVTVLITEESGWINFGINVALLVTVTAIALVGSKLFGKFIFVFLGIVIICTLSVYISFLGLIGPRSFTQTYNETTVSNCTANCTYKVSTGIFVGLIHGNKSNIANFTNVAADGETDTFYRDCHDRDTPVSLFSVFGVLFSGVTGILAGANLSGELKNPSVAIPKGTMMGSGFTFLVYLGLFIFTAFTCNRELLYHECFYMYYMDMWGPFVAIGTACATLCASLSCLLGASRVLHAVTKDNMFGAYFRAFNKEVNGNPIVAVLITAVFVALLFLYGSLNAIAQLCSVLYLLSYAAINLACFFLDAFSVPNFRPTFKYFHSSVSFVGFVLDFAVMFAINYSYAIFALVLCLVFTILLGIFSPAVRENDWGSIVQNFLLHQVRKYLLKLDPRKEHVKYWRPHIILLMKNPRYNCALLHFVNAMKKGGLYVIGHVHQEQFDEIQNEPRTSVWLDLIDHLRIKAFAEMTVTRSYREGVQHLVRISGVGAIKPNIAVMGFHEPQKLRHDYFRDPSLGFASSKMDALFPIRGEDNDARNIPESEPMNIQADVEFVNVINDVIKIGKNVCIYRNFDKLYHPDPRPDLTTASWWKSIFGQIIRSASCIKSKDETNKKYLDVWIIDFFSEASTELKDRKSLFMLQMAYIVTISSAWRHKLQLRVLIRVMKDNQELVGELREVLHDVRIKAEIMTIKFDDIFTIVEDAGAVVPRLAGEEATEFDIGDHSLDLMKIPLRFMTVVNKLILDRSDDTAASFLYLPHPPQRPEMQLRYLELLTEMTKSLPPTMLVHGIHSVTCTAL